MARSATLGQFEQAVLLAVVHLEDDAYGVTIRRLIESRTKRPVSVGALYTAIDRLEEKGFVQSTMSDPTPARGGRSKRHVRITASGRRALRDAHRFFASLWAGLDWARLGRKG